jgi:hypothetical protein
MASPAVRLPNFFLAGVPRAGTTSLYAYLGQHPQIYVSPVKEPGYFGAADLRRYGSEVLRNLVLEWESYLDLFRGVGDEPAVGEGTVGYFALPGAPRAIHAAVPHARLIFILRDPAERLLSHHLAALWHDPGRTFRERFLAAPPLVVEEGRFATNLARFFDLFPRDHIRIHLYEDYEADPRTVLRDLFSFLGVDPDYPVDLARRHNETVTPRWPAIHRLRAALGWGGTPWRSWIPARVRRWYGRGSRGVTLDPADRRFVIDFYRDEIRRTAELIGRDLSPWLR